MNTRPPFSLGKSGSLDPMQLRRAYKCTKMSWSERIDGDWDATGWLVSGDSVRLASREAWWWWLVRVSVSNDLTGCLESRVFWIS